MKIIEIGITILSAILMMIGSKDKKCEFFSFVNSLHF